MASEQTFYWHDYETFGANAQCDRPAQFGGLRTDLDLNIIGDPDLWYCQLSDDYLPDPEACLITGITPLTCLDEGLPEADFANKIFSRLSQPGTIGVGYNNLRFDDEISRFMFWRNLIDPYSREWASGCGRFDIYQLIRAVYAFRPEGIQWPKDEGGRVSLRLESLTKANGLAHSHAHDALSDAQATLSLARLIRDKQPRLWDHALVIRDQKTLRELLLSNRPLFYVNPFVKVEKRCLSLVMPIGLNPSNGKEFLCWDLAYNPEELFTLSAQDAVERFFPTKEQEESGIKKLPIIRIQINKMPFLTAGLKALTPELEMQMGLNKSLALQYASELQKKDLSFLQGLWVEVAESRPKVMAADPDNSLYSGSFISNTDRHLLNSLRLLTPEEQAEKSLRASFEDSRLSEMFFRFRARNFPETLRAEESANWYRFRVQRLIGGEAGWLTFKQYFAKLNALRECCADEEQLDLLEQLEMYGETLQDDFAA